MWIAEVMPGVNTASRYCAVYVVPRMIGNGPTLETFSPPAGACQPESSILSNQTLPKDSMTAPCGPLALSAIA
jgi:hypothetical protein